MSLEKLPSVLQYYISTYLSNDYTDDHANILLRYLAGPKYYYIKTVDANMNTYRNGALHSFNDKPAVIDRGNKYYCYNGIIHRIGGPAIYYATGTTIYYLNGHIHNANGPAVINETGHAEYYLNGLKYKK